ncbi:MAB_1171c family putative transporter [Streptomyces sp. NPDC054933]
MGDLKGVVFPPCAALCALAFLYKIRDLRQHRRDPALLALIAAFFLKGISFTLSVPAVSASVDAHSGVPNLGALGIHLLGGVSSSAAILVAVTYWVHPARQARPRARAWLIAAALCAVAMIALWLAAEPQGHGRSAHYIVQNVANPVVGGYTLLYATAFGAGMIEIALLCRRYAKAAGRQWLRWGMATTQIGAFFCIVYCANRAWAVIAIRFGLNPLQWEALTPIANGIGILFLATGLTMPSWGPQVSELRRRIGNFVAYRRLHPLWRDLYSAIPDIALSPPASARLDRFTPRDINYRLYRLVIEIQDGLLVLRPYMDPETAAAAARSARGAGLAGENLDAAVHAAQVKAALRARKDNLPTADGTSATAPAADEDGDYRGEVSRLVGVAQAYAALGRRKRSTT